MVRVIRTNDIAPGNVYEGRPLGAMHAEWIYNGLDCCLTHEIFGVISKQLDDVTRETYKFSLALQAPILEMNLRGVLIDEPARQALIREYESDLDRLRKNLDRILEEGLGCRVNWRSNKDLKELFYGTLRIPEIRKRDAKGHYVATVNREALERLRGYFHALPLVNHILVMRDLGKRIGTLKTNVDSDSRIRTAFNIAGTNTGRLSSSFNDFGTGTNLQNIEMRLRRIFIADKGMKYANIDLSQADARGVAGYLWNVLRDRRYLDACESGDLHTAVCKLAWRDLPWTGDPSGDRRIADQVAYRGMSYRDLAKRLGHGTNYLGTPGTMAKHTKTERGIIEDFQRRYFAAFPLQGWHTWVRLQLLNVGHLSTLTGRRRWFFGRRNDDSTVREAVAYGPQGTTADAINRGLLRCWQLNRVQVLLQVHDSVLIQYPEKAEDEILSLVLPMIEAPIELEDGLQLVIPAEAKVGWNWADANNGNPDGLVKYKGHDSRRRSSPPPSILDCRL